MSGGQLVVLDRLGRDVKRYPLPEGLATLGSDPACDIRVMLPTVSPHHATVVVHANQTVVRNVSTGETLVNGRPVSVAALRHRDTIEIGGRALRWEYTDQHADRPLAPQPALYGRTRVLRGSSRRGSGAAPGPAREPAVRLALELAHRASMPAPGRQVAIVQPQRRDTAAHNGQTTPVRHNTSSTRSRPAQQPAVGSPSAGSEHSARKARLGARNTSLQGTTKASLWIESRKWSPRAPLPSPRGPPPARRSLSNKCTPLRLAVLRRAQSASKARVTKIEAPTTVDHTKQAAILLMTRHAPKKSASPNRPSLVIKRRTPRASPKTPSTTPRSNPRASRSMTSQRTPASDRKSRGRPSRAQNVTNDMTLVELSDSHMSQSSNNTSQSPSPPSRRSRSSQLSPLLPSPKKSALKDPSVKKSTRKTESIKFDLSNLENEQSQDVFLISDVTRNVDDSQSETDITLHYDSSMKSPSPSPRKSIHSRSSKILERTSGTSKSVPQTSKSLTPESPRQRKSSRVSIILGKALDNSGNSRYSQRTTKSLSDESYDTVASAFKTRTLSPRSSQLESYSVVDLVSIDSNQSGSSVYNSMRSTKSSDPFGTPQNTLGRRTRSAIDPSLLTSSTPYVSKNKRSSKRSLSSPNISENSKNTSQLSGSSRRSKSLSTPENTQKHISVNSTRVSRASRSRSRYDSDLLLISTVSDDESSPKSSKRASRASKSTLSPKSPIISPKSITASIRKSKSLSSPESSPKSNNTGRSKSISSPKSPITSPKSNVSAVTRKTKSVSPKSPILSPKSNISVTRKTKSMGPESPLSSPKFNTSNRKTRSIGSPKSPVLSPKLSSTNVSIASPKSPIKSPKDNSNARKTRSKLSIPQSPANDGLSTPENRYSPVEVGTPVLSIQSLLDSSQSSLTSQRSTKQGRASLKRKTIGGIPPKPKKSRASLRSKSFNFGARKTASRLSRDSYETVEGTLPEEDIVTPKSAVKLVQEAVKNKHSTAKKPLSKRSMIDDLNESDIVKQLFNSPVKRKLSQSMTEFSRKQLFDDDDDVVTVKRPTRNTVALVRTPDNSLLNETESYTPEVFVSPLGTPDNSPNLTGVKRLFAKRTPENDLRNVKGVKGLLRTPRARRSVKNDLTRVSGVKNVFAKSPKNRLSDVRVKEVFVASPKNDLRRVTGVKALFQSQKKRRSPKNDLRDVRGVKQLFVTIGPENDLRNVSGVKKILRKNSPRNDLSDVRGVKRMFRQEKQQETMADVSGIEELFNESNQSYKDSESLFDRLIGKPPIKAVYSRTFTKKYEKPRRKCGSLHISIDEIIAKPEEWIQKELEKRFEKRSRELQKLATDTVEGNAPIRTSRVRNSTIAQADNVPRKRSTADNYSAHTLPIKKRSVVDSRENSRASRGSNVSSNTMNLGRVLPIKKRALVHSTPLKGRASAVLADLGRVSPIALDNSQGFTTTVVEVPVLQASRHNTKAKADTPKVEIIVTSPKKTRGKVSVVVSPKKAPAVVPLTKAIVISPKTTRNARKNDSASKKRATLAVAKKAPVSPKPKKDEPTKRTTRRQKLIETDSVAEVEKPKSPKRTRRKRASLVVSKPSPKMKPASKAKVSNAQTSVKEVPENNRRTRKTTASTESVDKKNESPKESARATRNRKTADVAKEATEKTTKSKPLKMNTKAESVEAKPAKTRGKKTEVSIEIDKKEGRATRGKKTVEQKDEAPKRGRKVVVAVEKKSVSPKRGKKVEVEKPVAQKRGKKVEVVEQKPVATRRGRNTEIEIEKVVSPKRGRKTQAVEPKPARKGRNTKTEDEKSESPKRGRKVVEKVELVAQTRGRQTEVAQKEVKVAQKRGQKADKTEAQVSNTSVSPKGKRGKASEPVQEKKTRGRKAEPEIEVKPTRGASKADVNRKRKSTAEEELPSKVRKTRKGDVAEAKARNESKGRQTRRNQSVAEAAAPASRKRKTAARTPVKTGKDAGKRAKPATPPRAGTKPEPRVVKRNTRSKR